MYSVVEIGGVERMLEVLIDGLVEYVELVLLLVVFEVGFFLVYVVKKGCFVLVMDLF